MLLKELHNLLRNQKMTETYKTLFNYKRLDEKDTQQFFATYHTGHTREFLEFISECVLETDDCSKYADNVNEFKPDYIGKKIQDKVGDLIDGEVYFINSWYSYDDSCCYSEIYFDMTNRTEAIQDTIETIKYNIECAKNVWGDDAVTKIYDEIQKQIIEE